MYGLAESRLPAKIAVPIKKVIDRLNYKQPLFEYNYGYALYNWKFKDDPNPDVLDYSNDDVVPDST